MSFASSTPDSLRSDGQQIRCVFAWTGFHGYATAIFRASRRARVRAAAGTPGRGRRAMPGHLSATIVAGRRAEQRGHNPWPRDGRRDCRRLCYGRLREHRRDLPIQDCLLSADTSPLTLSRSRCPDYTACRRYSAASRPSRSRTSGPGIPRPRRPTRQIHVRQRKPVRGHLDARQQGLTGRQSLAPAPLIPLIPRMLPAGQHWAKDLAERLAGRPDPLPSASWP